MWREGKVISRYEKDIEIWGYLELKVMIENKICFKCFVKFRKFKINVVENYLKKGEKII